MIMLMWHNEHTDYQKQLHIIALIFQMTVIKYIHMICESIGSSMFVSSFNDG